MRPKKAKLLLGLLLALRQVLAFVFTVKTDGTVKLALLQSLRDFVPTDNAVARRHHLVLPAGLLLRPRHVFDGNQRQPGANHVQLHAERRAVDRQMARVDESADVMGIEILQEEAQTGAVV